MDSADQAFLDYRNLPGPDTLVALLRSRQRAIYNVCLRTLRNPHDAEDAAQEILLEIIRGAGRIREPLAFRRWVSKVALHTALDHRRRRDRRARHEESRAAMHPESSPATVDAVHDALARLDDDDRSLLVEKYFEGATLEQLAAREGLSTAGVGKRIDRAKERLKQGLAHAGLGAFIPRVDSQLESSGPVGSTPDLVSMSAAVKSAVALAGGTLVGAKSVVHVPAAAAIVALLLIGGGAYVVSNRPAVRNARPAPAAFQPLARVSPQEPETVAQVDRPADSSEGPVRHARVDPAELLARLDRFKTWLATERPEFRTAADVTRWFEASKAETEGLRDLILGDPATFLEWLTRAENRTCASDLFAVTICGKHSMWETPAQDFAAFPRELTDGLLAFLHGSDDFLRCAVLQFALTVKDPPAAYRERCLALLSAPDGFLPELAAKALLTTGTLTPAEAGGVASYLERLDDFEKRANLMHSIGRVPREDIRDWMLTTLESDRFADPEGRLTFAALGWWLEPGRSPGAAFDDRASRILASAMRRVTDPQGYFYLLYGGVGLPLREAKVLLTMAMGGAPTEKLRRTAAAVLSLPDSELAKPDARRGAWLDAYWKK